MTTKAEITLPIYGMSCQKCVAKVSAALQAVDGVSAVVVSLEEQQGRVMVVDGGPGREELLGVVVATGFQIMAQEFRQDGKKPHEYIFLAGNDLRQLCANH